MITAAHRGPLTFWPTRRSSDLVPLAARVEGLRGQLLVCPKSPGLVQVEPTLVTAKAVPVAFVRVTACATPVVPTFWFPKSGTGDGERSGSDTPVPDTPAL